MRFFIIVVGSFLGMSVAFLFWGIRMNKKFPGLIKNMILSPNFREWFLLINKIAWPNLFESILRANHGKILERPFGTAEHPFDWKKIIFNPVYLSSLPLNSEDEVVTQTILGPKANKPLIINSPIMLGAMSYGNSLSIPAVLGLAKAAELHGTAVNTGNGSFIKEAREKTWKYIIQIPRGFWSRSEEILSQVDMIEIGLGHSAWGSSPIRIAGYKVTPELADRVKTIPGLDIVIESQLPEGSSLNELKSFVRNLKKVSGVPIAIKFGASAYLESEMDLMIAAGVDIIVFDGLEGGTHGSPPTIQDHFGLPTLPALCRAVNYIEKNKLKGKVSLVIGGGLYTPGDFLKCLALGADAVMIGTIAALSMTGPQVTKAIPWEPPTEVLYYGGKISNAFDVDLGAKRLSQYLNSCIAEMKELARSLGKSSLKEITKENLVALDPIYAKMAGIEYFNK